MTYGPEQSITADNEASNQSDFITMVLRLLRTVRYRKKIVFSAMYITWVVGAIYFFVAVRYYQSTAKLLVVEQQQDKLSSVSDHDRSGNTMTTHRELVKSPVVIEDAIKQLPPEHRVDLLGVAPRKWAEKIAKQLSAKVTRKTNLIEVNYRSKHPDAAAAVVRAVIQSYLNFVEKTHKGTAGEFIEVLRDGFTQKQQELTNKQIELQRFRKEIGHLAISADDQAVQPMVQRMTNLNDAWTAAQVKRLELQATEAAVKQGLDQGENINQHLMSIEATLGKEMMLHSMGLSTQDVQLVTDQQKKLMTAREEYSELATFYGPNHPHLADLQRQISQLTDFLQNYRSGAGKRFQEMDDLVSQPVILNMLARTVQEAKQKEQQLFQALQQARAEAAEQSEHVVQLQIMEHDIGRLETILDSLSEKIDLFDTSQAHAPIKATVVREPLPNPVAVTPQLRSVIVSCLLGGIMLGVLIAYVQDVLDDRFNSPEEISAQLGVPILAMVSNLESLEQEGLAGVHTHALPNSVETEAFRTLRTSISLNGEVCDRILISSSEPGDGKTTISANLSVALAQAGHRTLVIDADLRRPGFTTLANLKGHQGVADVLASGEPPEQTAPNLVQNTVVPNLDVLPVGLRRPNPAELLSGKAFVELLAWADSQYDRVIVDCPPVLAVSDAQIVGQLVDGAILVVRPEKNHRRSVIRAIESFQASGCRMLGVVANGLSEEFGSYGYGYGYGYAYRDGYGHDFEEDVTATEEPTLANPILSMSPAPVAHANVQITPTTTTGAPEPPIAPRKVA